MDDLGKKERDKRRWIGRLLLGIGVFAVLGVGIFTVMLSSWSELRTVSPDEGERSVAEVLGSLDGRAPYVEITESGEVTVDRTLEHDEPSSLDTLSTLVWRPEEGQLLQVDFPYWFVRMKMSSSINLGTLTSALARDWDNIDLRISEDDLRKHGPGLVLDHTRPDGTRVVLWTE